MEKYAKVRRKLQATLPTNSRETRSNQQLPLVPCNFRESPLATVEELTTTHCPEYVARFLAGDMTPDEERNVGFPWSLAGVNRALSSVGGTVAAARTVCDYQEQNYRKQGPAWAAHVAVCTTNCRMA